MFVCTIEQSIFRGTTDFIRARDAHYSIRQCGQAVAVDLINPLTPDDSTRPAARLQMDVPNDCVLGAGTGIDRAAGSQPTGLLRLKRSMTWPSESAITCAPAGSGGMSSGTLLPC